MILYFTFSEGPAASIYQTQVVDVVDHISEELGYDIRLLAFLPAKGFFRNRKLLRSRCRVSPIVLPQLPIPRLHLWNWNVFLLFWVVLIYRPRMLVCRSLFATALSLKIKELFLRLKVVFDSRGVITEEEKEYHVYPTHIGPDIRLLEAFCLKKADFCMFITEEMVNYFRSAFGYQSKRYVVIPCTLGREFEDIDFDYSIRKQRREALGYDDEDIVIAYSGSNAKWQSFDLMIGYMARMMDTNPKIKCLLLTGQNESVVSFIKNYPGRVSALWVRPDQVVNYLVCADYAIMTRFHSITNSVSSPTKFAEYLSCGLPVIANDAMAITKVIESNHAGYILDGTNFDFINQLKTIGMAEKKRIRDLGIRLFSKKAPQIRSSYQHMLSI
jgi:glycosyltransferase involved in cell wall biosynthesis